MCGITGAIWTNPDVAISPDILKKMTDVLAHRGPDDEHHFASEYKLRPPYEPMPGVALGFRRLSIIDLEGGRQPMSNEDDSIWMVFNGEIYNCETLRRRLEGAGHKFKTNSDSETILHLYEDEGVNCFKSLNGMFSVAIWDSNKRKLVLARDRVGQKPLFYRKENDRVLFASELKSILQVPGIPREIDYTAVDEFLTYQYVPHPNTIFRGFSKLSPGHYATFQDGKFETLPYWNPDFQFERSSITESEAVEELSDLLSSAVKMRMRSDVPLGAFLSGGVDSSLIVALMKQHSENSIKTFNIGFAEAAYDERKYARQVSKFLKTEHEELEVTPDAVSILPKLIWHYDEPFADSSAIPTWYVSEMTRKHVTVSLSGDGGDELFAGYPRYKAVRIGEWLDKSGPIKSILGSNFWQKIPGSARQKGFVRRMKRFNSGVQMDPLRRYLEWICIFNESRRAELYSDDFVEKLAGSQSDPFGFINSYFKRLSKRDQVTAVSLTDLQTYLPCDLMTKVDIASMGHSLEVRQPFLDYRVIEFAASLPVKLKYKFGKGKRILQKAFGAQLPKQIWNRKKMGFGVPIDRWFRSELKEMTADVLLSESAKSTDFFQRDAISKIFNEHQNRTFDHSYRLWSLLIFELWLREWT